MNMKNIFGFSSKGLFVVFILVATAAFFVANLASAAPYPQSSVITGISWDQSTLKRTAYGSDNFPTTWADDDKIYTIWGDGAGFNATADDSDSVSTGRVELGVARISGSPDSFSATNVWGGKNGLNDATFGGKAYGILAVDGVLYMLQGPLDGVGSGWKAASETTVGVSTDYGASWWRSGVILNQADGFCSPGFLNYGKDYAGAPDDYVYIYGRDCSGGDGSTFQDTAKISLARVSKYSLTNRSAYEFYAGTNGSNNWVSNSSNRRPVFINSIGYPEPGSYDAASAIYYPDIGRYLLFVTHGTPGSPRGGLGIYDGPSPWGPWTTVEYDDSWMGSDRFFYANIPTKWISGNSFYMVFTGTSPDSTIAEDAYQHMKGTFILETTPILTPAPSGYTYCAIEGGYCSFSGIRNVKYGAGTTFITKTFTGGTQCTNTVFTDPLPSTAKYCYYSNTTVPTPTPTPTSTNTPPAATITNPSSTTTTVNLGSTINFSANVSDPNSSTINMKWYIDRMGDGILWALIKEENKAPGTTSGTVTMSGTRTNTDGQTISLQDVGATYELVLEVSDGVNPVVTIKRVFTLTSSTPTNTLCHLLTSANTTPTDYGASYNVLSTAKELLMSVLCNTTSATITIGNNSQTQYIYNKGYTYKGGAWQQVTYNCSNLVSSAWCVGNANATINLTTSELSNTNYIVGYICSWTPPSAGQAGKWQCGCRDSSCSVNYWNLQEFRR